ncbi:tRNA lysidine(34) synthetase TilS [Cyanobium sp. Morenito 9A2]|uniref:tRNA lysidine(34) synthetase TilS n=1 Tax=Cyanobium sp. Morenito 9A2 TaxID=2823718 RepID=UPI0020CD73CB|nr:tRNA lysidine(34) synthetase TilS [Cyanobium sp. Morenito 9A2]MCP9850249.1 tRNA lysidine(34) synthetase TilS [Cyanobium sp. Morenito 9A2]
MTAILPSEPPEARPWSPLHERLHRELRRRPALLPAGEQLLLAVSGGQDSMALTQLLLDLRRLHGWTLLLWHGDHGWRSGSAAQAEDLHHWAVAAGLEMRIDRAVTGACSEAEARRWRYERLAHQAAALGCRRVVTGHTADDRAETLLLHLARGAHIRGLSSLRRSRPLVSAAGLVPCAAPDLPATDSGSAIPDPLLLVRPLLGVSRAETGAFCANRLLPVWLDPSNESLDFSRNRVRHQVLPVLEELHPGASRRLAALSERLEEEGHPLEELLPLALGALQSKTGALGLQRQGLMAVSAASQRQLLAAWLRLQGGQALAALELEDLRQRLQAGAGPGSLDLPRGWRLSWDRMELRLQPPPAERRPASRPEQSED